MCSRYAFVPEAAAWADFRAVLGALAEELLGLAPRPRLAPTDTVPILVQRTGQPPQVAHARWGLVPHWWSRDELPRLSFNARSEEAATKPMWRDALRQSRCLIPATSWTEWQKAGGAKVPHALRRDDGRGFMFAGLCSLWRPKKGVRCNSLERIEPENTPDPFFVTCAVLTMDATAALRPVHERMPVVLAPEAWRDWLDPSATDPAAALALLRRHAVQALTAQRVA